MAKVILSAEYTNDLVRKVEKFIQDSKEVGDGYSNNHAVIIEIVEAH